MQFLSSNTNQRTDRYGGSVQNRIRFVIEALEAMIAAAGSSNRVGIKISPAMPFNDIHDADPVETVDFAIGFREAHVAQSIMTIHFRHAQVA